MKKRHLRWTIEALSKELAEQKKINGILELRLHQLEQLELEHQNPPNPG